MPFATRNERAIAFYRREGFVDFEQKYRHKQAGVEYPSMILKLAAPAYTAAAPSGPGRTE